MKKIFKKKNILLLIFIVCFAINNYYSVFATNIYERNISKGYILGSSEKFYFENGDMMDLTGTIHHKDGTQTLPLGTVIDIYGITHYPDGTIKLPDGTIYYINGQIEYSENAQSIMSQINANNEVASNENNVQGSWKYEPVTNNWKYEEKNSEKSKEYKSEWVIITNKEGVSNWYAVDKEGNMITGWVKYKGKFYYMSSKPNQRGEMIKGKVSINGEKYVFDLETGELKEGKEPNRNFEVLGDDNHQSGKEGMWKRNKNGERYFTYYSKTFNGHIKPILPTGWFMIDGKYYFFEEGGVPKKGLIIFDNKYYYMNEDGSMKEGGQIIIGNMIYEFDISTGACISMMAF